MGPLVALQKVSLAVPRSFQKGFHYTEKNRVCILGETHISLRKLLETGVWLVHIGQFLSLLFTGTISWTKSMLLVISEITITLTSTKPKGHFFFFFIWNSLKARNTPSVSSAGLDLPPLCCKLLLWEATCATGRHSRASSHQEGAATWHVQDSCGGYMTLVAAARREGGEPMSGMHGQRRWGLEMQWCRWFLAGSQKERVGGCSDLLSANHMKQPSVMAQTAGGRTAGVITSEESAEQWKSSRTPHLLTSCSALGLILWCNHRATFLAFKTRGEGRSGKKRHVAMPTKLGWTQKGKSSVVIIFKMLYWFFTKWGVIYSSLRVNISKYSAIKAFFFFSFKKLLYVFFFFPC